MRVFMLKPLQLTAPREAGSPYAPGPCPGLRGQGFAPSSGGRPGDRADAGSWGRTARRGPSSCRKRAVGGSHCARRSERGALSPHNGGGPTRAGAGPAVPPGPPFVLRERERAAAREGAGGRGLRGSRGTRAPAVLPLPAPSAVVPRAPAAAGPGRRARAARRAP
ncbi:uncharacterized protein LOC132661264 [Panthera onca]